MTDKPEELKNLRIPLYSDETLEDLQRAGLRMIQSKNRFRFGLDSVLLAAFAAQLPAIGTRKTVKAADLCAGSGAVSLLLAARKPGLTVTGLEIDPDSCETFARNIELNSLSNRLAVVCGDVCSLANGKLAAAELPLGAFDLVVCNPPYRRLSHTLPPDPSRRMAREETGISLPDLVLAAARLLRSGGRLALIFPIRRLTELLCTFRDCGLEAKRIRMIQARPGKPPVNMLVCAVRHGRPGGLVVDSPLQIWLEPGVMSREAKAIYGNLAPLPPADLYRGVEPVDPERRWEELS